MWSPTITVGAVTIPRDYVEDLQLRLQLYRHLSNVVNGRIRILRRRMIDRFGPAPPEVSNCSRSSQSCAGAQGACRKVEAGPKGDHRRLRDNSLPIHARARALRDRTGPARQGEPDMKVVFVRDFDDEGERLDGTNGITAHAGRHRAEEGGVGLDSGPWGRAGGGSRNRADDSRENLAGFPTPTQPSLKGGNALPQYFAHDSRAGSQFQWWFTPARTRCPLKRVEGGMGSRRSQP